MNARTLPHDLDAETSVVGGILLYSKAYAEVADLVSADDFYQPIHGAIFQAAADLVAAGKAIDPITVATQMKANDTFSKLRAYGEAYFSELTTSVISVENIAWHARLVRGKATARKMIEAAQEIAAKGYGDYGDVGEYLVESQMAFAEVLQRELGKGQPIHVRKILGTVNEQLEARYTAKKSVTGIATGLEKVDEITSGLQSGDLIIIAGRPSTGKTSNALRVVRGAASYGYDGAAVPVLIFSLEMSKESLVERLLAGEGNVDAQRIRTGVLLDKYDWVNLTGAASRISQMPVWIDDTGGMSIVDLEAKARRWRADPAVFVNGAVRGLLVVDYLQLLHGRPQTGKRDYNREREVSDISRSLKALAKELGIPIVALAQLNRAVDGRADKRPILSDLRESGAIEQDADVIAFLYRDEIYNPKSEDKGVAEFIVRKQRNGATGTIRLAFRAETASFETLAERSDQGG